MVSDLLDKLFAQPDQRCTDCGIPLTLKAKQAVPSTVLLCAQCWQRRYGSADKAEACGMPVPHGAFND